MYIPVNENCQIFQKLYNVQLEVFCSILLDIPGNIDLLALKTWILIINNIGAVYYKL